MERAHKFIDAALCALFIGCIAGLGLWVILKAPDKISVSERRELSSMPAPTAAGVSDGTFFTSAEDYLLDQFPLRDFFRRIKAFNQYSVFRQTDNNGIIIRNGHAAQIDHPTEKDISVFFKRLGQLDEKYFSAHPEYHVYTCVIPDKMYFLADAAGVPAMDYADLRQRMAAEAPGTYIDIFDLLSLDDYYTTDTHWRQDRITGPAGALLSAMGQEPDAGLCPGTPLSPFYGVYYGQSALPLPPDEIVCVRSPVIDAASVLRADRTSRGFEEGRTYYEEYISASDPYDIFLGGACTVTVLTNGLAAPDNDRDLYLFSDSFGRSLAPLLLSGYRRVILYDVRYMAPSAMFALLPLRDGGQDVLLAYSISAIQYSVNLRTD